ncbi:flavodoxin [Campylobacter sp. MIT 12-5580]|uniref:flavodoxin n=1 Tax=Campylobacter sp. MIT 12-5580 TaxID=2040651 RepID=UPI0010F95EFF|nr:flavodoxin [Campylobacter sp. MIT 12-5580]TKX29601.1 flavodoxin [Campylobacter sp. MIT 12-5580]
MKILVAFFSVSGITKEIAQNIASITAADIFEISPQEPYSRADLDWSDENSRTSLEAKDKNSRPKIAQSIDISSYEVIFIGFPIWWYTAPHIIYTFLESYDFTDKTIVLFCTSGGSDLSNAYRDMEKIVPDAIFKYGKCFHFGESRASIRKWLESLNLK